MYVVLVTVNASLQLSVFKELTTYGMVVYCGGNAHTVWKPLIKYSINFEAFASGSQEHIKGVYSVPFESMFESSMTP